MEPLMLFKFTFLNQWGRLQLNFSYKLNTYIMQFNIVIECINQLNMFSLGRLNQ